MLQSLRAGPLEASLSSNTPMHSLDEYFPATGNHPAGSPAKVLPSTLYTMLPSS